jgi:hypothetical protein
MIRFFFRFLREKEKTRVFHKDSQAEARRESQAERVKWAGKKRISAENKNNKCLKQLLFDLNIGLSRKESFFRKFGSRLSLTRTSH